MSDNDELVERVAISLFEASYRYNGLGELPCWQECSYQANEKWRTLARATLSALRPGDEFNGMMVVPAEPTDDMLDGGDSYLPQFSSNEGYIEGPEVARDVYRAMLKAAKEDNPCTQKQQGIE